MTRRSGLPRRERCREKRKREENEKSEKSHGRLFQSVSQSASQPARSLTVGSVKGRKEKV
jgi:hypothetical protein